MQSEIEESKWFHSRLLEDVEVGIAIGHATDFWDLPGNTQALMIARFRVKGVRDAYQDKIDTDERRANSKKNRQGRAAMR